MSEREHILELREASAKARCAALWYATTAAKKSLDDGQHFAYTLGACNACRRVAATRYPLPKITRPRVVDDPEGQYEWTFQNGRLLARPLTWTSAARPNFHRLLVDATPERVKVWTALVASPFEEVEDDGSES